MARSDFGLGDAGLAELLAARAAMIAPFMLRVCYASATIAECIAS